jgi:NAD(P)-dependent dehydrogenase (short-subunit alcohol dehydrogenase family)
MTVKKVAVVTGGSAGLGLEMARTLARDGFAVAILGRRNERLRQAADDGRFHPYGCDVADAAAVARVAGRIVADLGRVDLLVNNAGVIRNGPLTTTSDADIQYQIAVNLGGVIHCTRAFADALKATQGSIINLSSALAKRPLVGTAVYAATKGAVEAFTRAMALEFGRDGIRVNCIAPGLVRSEIYFADGVSPASYEAALQEFASRYVLGRHGEPRDVAELVAFLASDKAAWITAAVLPVDSGYSNIGFRPNDDGS